MALSLEDKMRIQTLREQGLGAKAILAAYPHKGWKLITLKKICQRIDKTGSAVDTKVGSGRPKSARTAANVAMVHEMICSQEDESLALAKAHAKSPVSWASVLHPSEPSQKLISAFLPSAACQCRSSAKLQDSKG